MAMKNVGHMNAGDDENSYANNLGLQKVVISESMPVIDETLKEMFAGDDGIFENIKTLKMVDLGTSSGPNTLFVISHIISKIDQLYQNKNSANLPNIEVYLNDLPDNDFNNLFKLLQTNWFREEKNFFLYGLPCSFYDRLFPSNSLHFAYSSYSLHWLSQIPEGLGTNNKENIYLARSSSPTVFEAYSKQYQRNFSTFLTLRGDEMVPGGRMVLIFGGRSVEDPSSRDDCAYFTMLSTTLLDLVAEELVKMDDLYSFNVPMYTPCVQEVESLIQYEGSFNLNKLQTSWVRWDAHDHNNVDDENVFIDRNRRGKLVADCVRAVLEPMLVSHFGSSIIDELFGRYADKIAEHLPLEKASFFNIAISLCRK